MGICYLISWLDLGFRFCTVGSTGFSSMLVFGCMRCFCRCMSVFKSYISFDNPHLLLYSSYRILVLGLCFCTVRLIGLKNINFESSVSIMVLAEHYGVDLGEQGQLLSVVAFMVSLSAHLPCFQGSLDAGSSFLLFLRMMLIIPENITSEQQFLGIIALHIPGHADSTTAFGSFEVLMKFLV